MKTLATCLVERAWGHRHVPAGLGWGALVFLVSLGVLCGCATTSNAGKTEAASDQPVMPAVWSRPRFSPDGTRLAAIRNWEKVFEFALPQDRTGREVALPFQGAQGQLLDLNYDASGDLLVLCHVTNRLTVWNAQKGAAVTDRPLHATPVGGLLSRNRERAVVCFQAVPGKTNGPVALINWASGGEIVSLPEHQGILGLALSGGGQRLATLDGTQVGRIWNAETGALVLTLPTETQRRGGITLDEDGDTVALRGADTRIRRVDESTNQPAVLVPNPAPKGTTVVGGIGIVVLETAVGLIGNTPPQPQPQWFKAPPTFGVCLSDDGQRVAMLNPAPNLKGEFQLRLADARTGRPDAVRGLSSSFIPSGPPVFSPNGRQVAVPGNGVRVLGFGPPAEADSSDLWLAKSEPGAPYVVTDWRETRYFFQVEPVRAVNSVSSLARATHHRVCVEATENASGNETWVVPMPFGMKKVFIPRKPVSLLMNESLRGVWQDCGHELVHWGQEMNLSTRITKWQLEVEHSVFKGWDLTATIEVELNLTDATGTLRHTARYAGKDHQTELWEPSDSCIAELNARALSACLADMKNDPKWGQALATTGSVAR